jgi:hypothetical protein
MSKMQITLSYCDLEKLLLDESGEFKVSIGRQIAENFARKYLLTDFKNEIQRQLENAQADAKSELLRISAGLGQQIFTPSFAQDIKAQARANTRAAISDIVNDAVQEILTDYGEEKLSGWIKDSVTFELRRLIHKEVHDAYKGAINSVQIK